VQGETNQVQTLLIHVGWDAAPEEVKGMYAAMLESFRKLDPKYEGPILPKQSVEDMVETIGKVTIEQSGEFLSHVGDKNWLAGHYGGRD
jgi:hypothetical protein